VSPSNERFGGGKFSEARDLFVRLSTAPKFEEFLTLPAYDLLLRTEPRPGEAGELAATSSPSTTK
jgi:hypothetical protein